MKWLVRAGELVLVSLLSLLLAAPQDVWAQNQAAPNHVVSPSDIQKDLADASAAHERDLAQVESFFSSPQAQQALKTAHMTYQQVDSAVQQLSSEDLARLSARSQQWQNDFSAGRITDRDLLFILIGVAVLILIIVAVR